MTLGFPLHYLNHVFNCLSLFSPSPDHALTVSRAHTDKTGREYPS